MQIDEKALAAADAVAKQYKVSPLAVGKIIVAYLEHANKHTETIQHHCERCNKTLSVQFQHGQQVKLVGCGCWTQNPIAERLEAAAKAPVGDND